jgi:hypothetical protein
MHVRELICDTPIETVWVGSIRLQLVPKNEAGEWWVFSWPKRVGELAKASGKWIGLRSGKQVVSDSDRYVVLGVLALMG